MKFKQFSSRFYKNLGVDLLDFRSIQSIFIINISSICIKNEIVVFLSSQHYLVISERDWHTFQSLIGGRTPNLTKADLFVLAKPLLN